MKRNQFGDMIAERRRELGLTLEEVSRRVALHVSYLSLLENGKRTPSPRTVSLLAKALCLSALDASRAAFDNCPPRIGPRRNNRLRSKR